MPHTLVSRHRTATQGLQFVSHTPVSSDSPCRIHLPAELAHVGGGGGRDESRDGRRQSAPARVCAGAVALGTGAGRVEQGGEEGHGPRDVRPHFGRALDGEGLGARLVRRPLAATGAGVNIGVGRIVEGVNRGGGE